MCSHLSRTNNNNVEEEIENVRLSVLIVKDIAHASFGLFPLDGWPSWEQKETAFDLPKIIPSNAWQRERYDKHSFPLPVLYKMGMNPIQPLVEFLNIHYRGHDVSMVILSMPRKTPM